MAKTYIKGQLAVEMPGDVSLAVWVMSLPEAASQTFKNGSPLVFSSGYLATASGTVESVEAFALEDAHNGTAGEYDIKCCPALHNTHCFGNLLTTGAADNVLAATDWGVKVQLLYNATAGAGSTPIWFFGDSASNPCFKVVDFKGDAQYLPANQSELRAAAGDTNARVKGVLLTSAADWAT